MLDMSNDIVIGLYSFCAKVSFLFFLNGGHRNKISNSMKGRNNEGSDINEGPG